MNIYIQEKIIDNIPVNMVKIDILTLIFNNSATFRVRYNVNSYYEIQPSYIKIEGDDYKNWKNDDFYIINKICSKLDLTPLQPDYFHQSDPFILDPISYPIDPVVYPIYNITEPTNEYIVDPIFDISVEPIVEPIV